MLRFTVLLFALIYSINLHAQTDYSGVTLIAPNEYVNYTVSFADNEPSGSISIKSMNGEGTLSGVSALYLNSVDPRSIQPLSV